MLREVPLARIRPNPYQPRNQFGEQGLSALVDSIKAVGILQPVLVREVGPDEYELIAGERRFRAARRAGLQTMPALVHQADEAMSLEEALVENLHREDLNPLDEAGAYQQLIEEFNLTHEEVARKVGRSRAAVTNALRLFQLPPTVQRHVRDGQLTAGHARCLLGTPDRALQERLAGEAIHNGLSVRALEELVRAEMREEQDEEAELESAGAGPEGAGGSDEGGAAQPRQAVPKSARTLRPPGVHDLEELLETRLNTRVKVDMGGKRGKLVIEFATLDDLERIYRVIVGETST
ncbi:MAG: ParB/RepB/Spo0J family partition protein [Acidimicrobiales bacterium]|jgi:ParB family chromosome partitioning protein